MSFILDALKKSEAERRKGEVPRLQNEPFSPPPRRRPVWPLLLAVALLLNAAVFGWWLLAGEDERGLAEVAAVSSQKDAAVDRTAGAEPVRLPAGVTAGSAAASGDVAAQEVQALKAASPAPTTAPASSAEPAVVTEVLEQLPVRSAAPVISKAPGETAERDTPTPRTEAPVAAPARPKVASVAPAAEAFPPVSELPGNVRAGLPRLDLQLHFYTPDPERRLVRLNGVNLRQGGSSGDGLNVLEITQDGVKLSYGGNRFFLPTGRP